MSARRTALALLLALALTLSGCGREGAEPTPAPSPSPSQGAEPSAAVTPPPQEGRAFTLPLDPAGGWDPYAGSRSGNMSLAPLLYESLFELDSAFAWSPLLAQGATVSEDGLVWTVTLRAGVTFSNGQALDSGSAAQAIEAARGPGSVYAARLAAVRSVAAPDEATLTFTLAAPNARFPALLDFPIALTDGAGTWGTGPYVLQGDRLTARSDWWRGLSLPLEEIPLLEAGDGEALVTAFNEGRLSLAAGDPTGSDALGYAGSYQSWEYPTSNLLYLGFQCARGPGRSAGFRRGVSLALDRQALVSQVLGGHATAAALPVPAASALYDQAQAAAQTLTGDLASAAQALDQAGYPAGEDGARLSGRAVALVVNSDNVYKARLAQAVADTLGQLGLTVQVRTLSWEAYKTALEEGDFDLYLGECRLTGDLDPSPFLTRDSGLCYGGFSDGALTQALWAARQSGEWTDFYDRWAQQVPLAAICFKNAQLLTQWGQVEGADPTQGNLFHRLENWKIG